MTERDHRESDRRLTAVTGRLKEVELGPTGTDKRLSGVIGYLQGMTEVGEGLTEGFQFLIAGADKRLTNVTKGLTRD